MQGGSRRSAGEYGGSGWRLGAVNGIASSESRDWSDWLWVWTDQKNTSRKPLRSLNWPPDAGWRCRFDASDSKNTDP